MLFRSWFALWLMGAPISLEGAVAMESLLFASRSLAFFMPNALGVQEGAYALLAPLVGLSPADALALSLIKRARDLVIGAPALLIWQRAEAARVWGKRAGRAVPGNAGVSPAAGGTPAIPPLIPVAQSLDQQAESRRGLAAAGIVEMIA